MKLIIVICILALAVPVTNTYAQDDVNRAGPIKGTVVNSVPHKPHLFEFALNGNAAAPMGTGIKQSLRFNPCLKLDYFITNHFLLGLEGNYLSVKPDFDVATYTAPFAAEGFASISSDKTKFTSFSALLNVSYKIQLMKAKEKANCTNPNLRLSWGTGIAFNSSPNQLVTQKFNGVTDTIAIYKAPDGYSKMSLVIQPAATFSYWFTPVFGVNVNVQYQAQLGSKNFTYSYKDLSNVNFNGPLDVTQFQLKNAPIVTQATQGPKGFFSFGAGIVISFGGQRLASDSTKKRKVKDVKVDPTTMRPTTGFNMGTPAGQSNKEKPADTTRHVKTGHVSLIKQRVNAHAGEGDNMEDIEDAGQSNKEKPADTVKHKKEYVGHITLIKREMGPGAQHPGKTEYLEPLTGLPATGKPITVYTISDIQLSGEGGDPGDGLPIAYSFYYSGGKTIAVPFPIFDLPAAPNDLSLARKKFRYKQLPVEIVRMSEMPYLERTAGGQPGREQYNFSYQAMLNGKPVNVSMALTATDAAMSGNPVPNEYWCGVSTNCGVVFAVQVTNGTPCASVNSFFNRVCNSLLKNQTE